MVRFLLLGLPVVLLTLALGAAVGEALQPGAAATGLLHPSGLAATQVLGGWLLEALALTALFLLVQGRGGAWWLDGLITGFIAWVFRGPLLILTVAAASHLPREQFWILTQRWFVLYPLCGLLLAGLARWLDLRR